MGVGYMAGHPLSLSGPQLAAARATGIELAIGQLIDEQLARNQELTERMEREGDAVVELLRASREALREAARLRRGQSSRE
jgi:hypothetical protein